MEKVADDKRKAELFKLKMMEGMADADIVKSEKENETLKYCKECNRICHLDTLYRKFSTSTSTCVNDLLCPKVSLI